LEGIRVNEVWGFFPFVSQHSHRLLAAFLEGFRSLQQIAYDNDFSCASENSVTKFCPELKIDKKGRKTGKWT